jgi:hypothetical protein
VTALARAIQRPAARRGAPDEIERCDVCGAELPMAHRHMVDAHDGELRCACRACALLFQGEPAAHSRYRLVPTGRRRLPQLPAAAFEGLGLPVGLAFIVTRPDGTALAHYPSPAGATRWELEAAVWQRALRECAELAELEPDVQALLLHTARGRHEHWIVPIDDCYRLVALIRREWRGLSGGGTVWPAIAEFFADLAKNRE